MDQQAGALSAVGRRWYVVLIGLACTALLCAAAASLVPGQYVLTARVLLVPSAPVDEPLANPYLSLAGLEPATSVLARTISSAEGSRQLQSSGATGTFVVAQDALTAGPVLLVEVRDRTPQAALATVDVVLQALPRTLEDLQVQVGVPTAAMIKSTVISQDTRPLIDRRSQTRAVLVAGVGGTAATLLGAALLDGLLLRRRRPSSPIDPQVVDPLAEYEPVHLSPSARKRHRGERPVEERPAPVDATR